MIRNMQLLQYFLAVANKQHFTKSAQELYISQSTLSKSIDMLEKEIGVPLFEKQGRNVKLTRYGEILLDYVQRGEMEIETGIGLIQNMVNAVTGTVYIASIFTMGSMFLPQIIGEFKTKYPGIKIHFHQKTTRNILDQIVSGDLDIGFVGEFERSCKYMHIEKERLFSEELCLIVSENHPLATRKSIAFDEVLDEVFIGWNEDTGIYLSIDNIMKSSHIEKPLKYEYYVSEDSTMVGMVAAGLGVGLLSTAKSIKKEGVVSLQITRPYFFRDLYLAWNRDRYMSPAAKAFRNFMLVK